MPVAGRGTLLALAPALLLLCASAAPAQEAPAATTRVVVSAEVAATGRTPEQAWDEALQRARAEAVSRVSGFHVSAQDLRLRSETEEGILDAFSSLVHTSATGRILSERVHRSSRMDEELGVAFYAVTLEAEVVPEQGARDSGFTLELTMEPDSHHLRDGEELRLALRSSRDGYLTVLNVLSEDRVALLFPNPFEEEGFVPAGKEVKVPGAEARRRGVRFRAYLPEGRERAAEMILAVVTRDPVPLDFPVATAAAGELPSLDYQGTLDLLNRWLVELPLDRRAEVTWQYEIHR
jgi:hypothetical protein